MTDPSDSDEPFDRATYITSLIRHRVPEATDVDLATLASAETIPAGVVLPDDAIPVAIADKICDAIEWLESRMTALEAAVGETAPAGVVCDDPVEACRRALVDMTPEEKVVVVDQLQGWIEYERRSAGERLQ